MVLLEESIVEAAREIEDHHKRAVTAREPRRAEALALTVYKLNQLASHAQKSRRILNDLRTLRNLLFETETTGV